MLIPCPHCGNRDHSEFTYGGDANVKRPENSNNEDAWYEYVYARENPCDDHDELWHHTAGCRTWIVVTRHTRTHEISNVTITDAL